MRTFEKRSKNLKKDENIVSSSLVVVEILGWINVYLCIFVEMCWINMNAFYGLYYILTSLFHELF